MTDYSIHSEIGFFLLAVFGFLTLLAHAMDPFGKLSRVKKTFQTVATEDDIVLVQRSKLEVRTSLWWKVFAYYKCAWHIISNVRAGRKAKSKVFDEIVRDIHWLRFDPRKPYLISGDHFNVLYPRNLGIFYHSTLDAHTALNELDWEHRQRIYLQTVAFALEVRRVEEYSCQSVLKRHTWAAHSVPITATDAHAPDPGLQGGHIVE